MIKKIGRVLFYDYNKNHFGRIQDDISGVSLNFKLGKRENDLFLKDDQLIFYDLQLAKNGISYYAKDISIINSIDFTIGDYRSIIRLFSQNNIDKSKTIQGNFRKFEDYCLKSFTINIITTCT